MFVLVFFVGALVVGFWWVCLGYRHLVCLVFCLVHFVVCLSVCLCALIVFWDVGFLGVSPVYVSGGGFNWDLPVAYRCGVFISGGKRLLVFRGGCGSYFGLCCVGSFVLSPI